LSAASFRAARSASYGHLTLLRVAPTACPHKAGFNEPCSVRIADRRLTLAPDCAQEDEFQSALRISKDYLNGYPAGDGLRVAGPGRCLGASVVRL
jgi:hypothetical protein